MEVTQGLVRVLEIFDLKLQLFSRFQVSFYRLPENAVSEGQEDSYVALKYHYYADISSGSALQRATCP